ncbi:MAG: DUF4364 family protein [Suipraeoptans sp.]
MADTFKLYKLIILYMLNKVDFPLTTSQISEFIVTREYTTFFKMNQALSELRESGFLREETTHNRTIYHLNDEGAETIRFFKNEIPNPIQDDINKYLRERKFDLKSEVSIKSDYYKNENNEYTAHCSITEQKAPVIDLSLSVPSKDEAEKIASNWESKSDEIYSFLIKKLL